MNLTDLYNRVSLMEIESFDYINEIDKKNSAEFINSKCKKFVLGRNKWADSIIGKIYVDGIIDDFCEQTEYKGCKIYKMTQVPKDSIVVSAITGFPKTAKEKLNSLNIKNIDYFAFYKYSGLDIEKPPFISDFKNDFLQNKNKYKQIYSLLQDKTSKEIFQDIINFKITYDLKFMKRFNNKTKLQYFEEDFFKVPPGCIFVDGGGYVGDTSLNFIEKYPDYNKIYLFEPIKTNMEQAKTNLIEENVEFLELGLSDFSGKAAFNSDESSSKISEEGNMELNIDYIDNIFKKKVDFIKLDIEGSELNAIDGASKLIARSKPILAICIYHKASDWYEIPNKILGIYNKYTMFLRHYMEGIYETVIYFIPPDKLKKQDGQ